MELQALLEDHANGRIWRERVFRGHIDLLVHKKRKNGLFSGFC
jgi:hypothetical protein